MGNVLIGAEWHYTAQCPTCKVQHTLPQSLYEAAKARAGELVVYCPHGHNWVYTPKEQLEREEMLRQERDRLKQQLAYKDDEIKRHKDMRKHSENRVTALKGVVTRTKNRVSNGVCPCCNRTFSNLARHMHNKHPEYPKIEEVA